MSDGSARLAAADKCHEENEDGDWQLQRLVCNNVVSTDFYTVQLRMLLPLSQSTGSLLVASNSKL